jgi:hypothetical protein
MRGARGLKNVHIDVFKNHLADTIGVGKSLIKRLVMLLKF